MIAPNLPTLEEISSEFTAFLPGLAGRLANRFRRKDPEAQADAVAEAVGLSWLMYLSARMRSKKVGPSTLAFYAGRSVDAGRKVAGHSSKDAMSDSPTARERIGQHVSLDDGVLSQARFYMTFGDRRWRWPVHMYVALRLDFQSFLTRCGTRDRRIVEMKAEGHRQEEIAARLGVSASAVCQRVRILRRRWEAMSAV